MYRIYFIDNCNKVRTVQVNSLDNVNLGVINFIIGIDFCGQLIPVNSLNFSQSQNLERFFYGVKSLDSINYLLNNVVLQPVIRELEIETNSSHDIYFLKQVKKESAEFNISSVYDEDEEVYITTIGQQIIIPLPSNAGSKRYCVTLKMYVPNDEFKDVIEFYFNCFGNIDYQITPTFKVGSAPSLPTTEYRNFLRTDFSFDNNQNNNVNFQFWLRAAGNTENQITGKFIYEFCIYEVITL